MVVDIGEVKRHIKPKADSTLRNMRKDDLIKYIRCLENNYNVAVSFNENQAKYIESLGALPVWTPVSEQLPESGVHVLLCCEIRSNGVVYKKYVCDGYYAKRYTDQTWNNSGDIACEYREEDDEYYLLEGWYEVIKNWDDYNSILIGDFVTQWMPMPEMPKKE